MVPSAPEFDVYGCRFRVVGTAAEAVADLAGEFAHFRGVAAEPCITIDLQLGVPPYASVPPGIASVSTPRNISFRHGPVTYVDYGGSALAVHDESAACFRVFSESRDLLYEAAYLFLLSRIGEFLDARRLHRVHALAMSLNGRAILVLLPMGGGKSTLGWGLMRFPELRFLSDDSPLIDGVGGVHAFPLRMGLMPGHEADVPLEYRRTVPRMEFGPKVAIHYDYFASRVVPHANPGLVLLGRRSLATDCVIEPAAVAAGQSAMLANCVVGLGLFQGMEFVLNAGLWRVVGKTRTAVSRGFLIAADMHGRRYPRLGRPRAAMAAPIEVPPMLTPRLLVLIPDAHSPLPPEAFAPGSLVATPEALDLYVRHVNPFAYAYLPPAVRDLGLLPPDRIDVALCCRRYAGDRQMLRSPGLSTAEITGPARRTLAARIGLEALRNEEGLVRLPPPAPRPATLAEYYMDVYPALCEEMAAVWTALEQMWPLPQGGPTGTAPGSARTPVGRADRNS